MASTKLHKTQPAVSIAIKKLEQQIGFKLFNREGYRLDLTTDGKSFYTRSQKLLAQHEQLTSYCHHLKQGIEPQIHIAFEMASYTPNAFQTLTSVQRQFPLTEFHISGEDRLNALNKLINGDVELAISPWLPTFAEFGKLQTRFVDDFELIDVISQSLVDEIGFIPTTAEQLYSIPQLLPEPFAVSIDAEKIIPCISNTLVKTNNTYIQRGLLLAGMGWGLSEKKSISSEIASGALIPLNISAVGDNFRGEVHIVKRANDTLGTVAKAVWDAFAK